ncbi:MAG: small multi-drug export protein [Flavobacteriales bacterium]|nr:small multi-drug export protein [Flavobacteriales bacterium]
MFIDIVVTFLISLSPLGEARSGIPYGMINDISPVISFITGTSANLLVYPLLTLLIHFSNKKLWNIHFYRKYAVKLARRSKRLMGNNIDKYGAWGLMVFVLVPLPGTGAYMGTIAAYILNIKKREAFIAVSVGTIVSSLIVVFTTHFAMLGVKMF